MDLSTTTSPNVANAVETVVSHLHPTPSWDIADHPMPKGLEELWRFTPVKQIRALLLEGDELPGLTWESELPDGVEFTTEPKERIRELVIEPPVDRVAAIAAARTSKVAVLRVPAGMELPEAVVLTGTGNGEQAAESFLFEVGAGARATLVLQFRGSGSYACKYDIRVGDGAEVNLVNVNDWDSDAIHAGQLTVEVGRDARIRTVQASLGGNVIRLVERAAYTAPGGELEQFGLYFVESGQHVEHRLFVDHNMPKTRSNVDYRGALQGEGAHSVWIGDVLIRKVAEGIDTYEANKNLVLTDGCRADSVPNLEIETGEIEGAGHSSTTGRFDDIQLFYLRSRGIPEAEARRLVVHGFFNDIIRRIGVPEVEKRLLDQVEKELDMAAEAMRAAQ
ncbi:FeS cluster assembly protein sufD [Arachnia propionica]|jgi:feS assembly protein sufD|nr:SufD family Fe-S cluster assembly protein [Arachnia propionica]VEJ58153.1 FeS cluster assembly protein sufD [Arachnia propionica]